MKIRTIVLSNNDTITTRIDYNGVAVFNNVPHGLTGYLVTPIISGYSNPETITFDTNSYLVSLDAVYHVITNGIYMSLSDGREVTFDSFNAQTDDCIALHIATPELLSAGCDYYVKLEEFERSWFGDGHKKAWSTQSVLYPNVPNYTASDYDGKSATALMLSDADTLRATYPDLATPAATMSHQTNLFINGQYLGG